MRKTQIILAAVIGTSLVGAGSATAGSLITSAKIKDGTIAVKDLSPATRSWVKSLAAKPGARGAAGASGAAGATGAAGAAGANGAPGAAGSSWQVSPVADVSMSLGDADRLITTIGGVTLKLRCADDPDTRAGALAPWATRADVIASGPDFLTGPSPQNAGGMIAYEYGGQTYGGSTRPGISFVTATGLRSELVGDLLLTSTSCAYSGLKLFSWQD